MLAMTSVLSVAASALLSGLALRFALSKQMLDVPNERSSHTVPTPRGGGIAIVAVVLVACGVLGVLPDFESVRPACIALAGGGLLVAGIGWIDDRRPVPAATRAAVHVVAASWAVGWLGGMPTLWLGGWSVPLGAFGSVVAVIAIAWFINLYNFMDGIDGIAGGQAVVAAGFAAAILFLAGDLGLSLLSACLAAASLGFLFWNWSPARIFMGDVGSGTVGFFFGTLALASEQRGTLPAVIWLLLLGVFVFDATVTLLRRIARGQKWYAAHRSHAYQRATQAGLSHRFVSLIAIVLYVVLGALALFAWSKPDLMLVAVGAGISVLTGVYLRVERLKPM